ncbi:hypothetical protein GEU84_008170 [Fertoebacter nigrum]|uniref:Uncharacterized protein n=1 Tax=Fertoeibacter niger TaxID=2656921 RepID=A0A8X8KNS4_9RHOB|nr:hypothetical protein [Fertoeibacter niger]NUB44355.1 hypothetical protein [Fertoeibacter niger]
MRHDWIFDVLADLRSYAQKNRLTALAAQVEDTLRVARTEIAAADTCPARGEGSGGAPPAGRPH